MILPYSPFLCVITDEAFCPVTLAEEALKGGAAMIQLRHKGASGSQLFNWAVEIRKRCREYKALFIINDRVDIAMASRSDGVHLGQLDMPADAARKLLGKSRIIGISASSPAEALIAEKNGADYIGFGHIYPTSSKEKGFLPVGPKSLREAASLVSLPLIAIGGINVENAASLIDLGASGVAVISAVSRDKEPASAAHKLVRAIQNRNV